MKSARIIGCVVGAALLALSARAQDPAASFERLVGKWQAERQTLVGAMVQRWLRGADTAAQKDRLTRLVQLDVRLANEPGVPLYVTQFKDPNDPEQCVRDVVNTELRHAGLCCDSKVFFQGRSFLLRRTDGLGTPAADLAVMKWKKGGPR